MLQGLNSTRVAWDELRIRGPVFGGLGYPNYFPDRHKRKMLELAGVKQSDVFYDLGCGDASILIFAVKEFGVRKAVGFESNPIRRTIARRRISQQGYSGRISIEGDFFKADLTKADVIFSMLMEYEIDSEELFGQEVHAGTRLIKHDLPLIGYDYDNSDFPFYLIRFPLRKLPSAQKWAARIMAKQDVTVGELWHELYYYQYEKSYSKWDIKRFDRILRKRFAA